MARSQTADGGDSLHIRKVDTNTLNKELRQPRMGGPPSKELGEGLTTSRRKTKKLVTKCYTRTRTWTD
jgi:hypothetical protein